MSARRASTYFNRRGELRHIKSLRYWPLAEVLCPGAVEDIVNCGEAAEVPHACRRGEKPSVFPPSHAPWRKS